MTGYVSLGHVVFYGLGAYLVVVTWQQLAAARSRSPRPASLAALFAALVGLPVLRVRGPVLRDPDLRPGRTREVQHPGRRGGERHGEPDPVRRAGPGRHLLRDVRAGAAATLLLVLVSRSRFGHGLRSLRENEEAAETLGVPVVRYKLIAFVLSAAIPGMVGAVMALRSTYFVVGQVFDPMISVTVIAMALLGGGDDAARADARHAVPVHRSPSCSGSRAPLALHADPRRRPRRLRAGRAERHRRPRRQRTRARRAASRSSEPASRAAARGPRPRQALRRPDARSPTSRSRSRAGETVGIMGANGAGKTTLFSLIAGNARPSAGTIAFDGAPHRRPLARPDLPPRRRPHLPDRQAVPRR